MHIHPCSSDDDLWCNPDQAGQVTGKKGTSAERLPFLTINEFLFQVREQLGEIRMRDQQEQNGVADVHPSQVRVQRSQGTHNFLSQSAGQ